MLGETAGSLPGIPRVGYDPDFLGTHIDVPVFDQSIQDDAILLGGTAVVPYTHFSLTLSKSRRFARWVGWNIDGGNIKLLSRADLDFTKDPRLPSKVQIGNELYSNNRLDRGHIARRADLLWGDLEEAQQANQDSFYYSNITPQMDDFNQSRQQGIWGLLENALLEDVVVEDLRVSVFGGPVFGADDVVYRGTALPSEYWKVLVFQEDRALKVRAFLLTQNLDRLKALLSLDEFRVYQVSLGELEERTLLRFPEALNQADTLLPTTRDLGAREPLNTAADIIW